MQNGELIMTIQTKNFNPEADPKLLCTCGHPECDRRSVNQETLEKLQCVRDDYGKPLTITSGGRCPNHPDQSKKTDPDSGDHPAGKGVDIYVTSRVEFNRIALIAGRYGFNAIGDGLDRGFMHLGVRLEGFVDDRVRSWSYA